MRGLIATERTLQMGHRERDGHARNDIEAEIVETCPRAEVRGTTVGQLPGW
jgi:hypothetical protein